MSKGTDMNKADFSQECTICHYWYFININFRLQPELCNGCHELLLKSVNFNYIAIVPVKKNDYKIYFWYMSKCEAINLLRNADLIGKSGIL